MSVIAITVLTLVAATGFAPIAAPAAWILLAWCPGRILLRATGIGRGWDGPGRTLLALAASLVFMPAVLFPIWHFGHSRAFFLWAVWGVLIVSAVAVRLLRPWDHASVAGWVPSLRLVERRATAVMLAVIALFALLATIGPYWPNDLNGYPVPASIHDYIKHHAVMYSLQERHLPLGNPFYAAEAAGPVYYYCFFYLIPATVRIVAGGPGTHLAFGVQSFLVAVSTIGMFYLIVKRFTGGDGPAILAALLSSLVGGLDSVAAAVRGNLVVTLDSWADTLNRVHNLFTQMMWTPQNVLGLLVVLLVVYVLSEKGFWPGWFVLGPAAGAAAWGSSPWVAVALFAGLGVWWVWECIAHGRERAAYRRLAGVAVVGLAAGLAAAPIVLSYMEMSARHGKGLTTEWPYSRNAWLGRLVAPGPLANLLDLPWTLPTEFGAMLLFPLLLVPRAIWRRAWADAGLRLLLICTPLAIAGFVTIRSHFMYNDFGQKSIMVAMAAGVILGACAVRPDSVRGWLLNPFGWRLHAGSTPVRRRSAAVLFVSVLVLGLPVGLSEIPLTAVRRYLPDRGRISTLLPDASKRAKVEGPAWGWMHRNLPADAVLQMDPSRDRVFLVQAIERQMGVTVLEANTMVFHPVDAAAHTRRLEALQRALYEPGTADDLQRAFRACGVTHVYVGTLELEQWKCVDLLEDASRYEPLWRTKAGTVYAVR